jgi:hypothetical protein
MALYLGPLLLYAYMTGGPPPPVESRREARLPETSARPGQISIIIINQTFSDGLLCLIHTFCKQGSHKPNQDVIIKLAAGQQTTANHLHLYGVPATRYQFSIVPLNSLSYRDHSVHFDCLVWCIQ